MQIRWTENQKKAIDKRGCNILVTAAAGSGKTAVLVERVQKMLTNHELDINRLLITTFTNAAASEMRQRILKTLTEKLEQNNKDTYMQRQLTLFEHANIGTIHSFCQNLMRNNFHQLGLSANFKIADDADTILLKKQAFDAVLEERYNSYDEGFLQLVDCYGGKSDDSAIIDIVFRIYEFARSTPNPKNWLNMCRDNFIIKNNDENKFLSEGWGKAYIDTMKVELEGIIREYNDMLRLVKENIGFEKYIELLLSECEYFKKLKSIAENPDWDVMHNALNYIVFDRLPRRAKGSDEGVADIIKSKRSKIKSTVNDWVSKVFYADAKSICSEIQKLKAPINALCDLIIDFDEYYGALKRENNIVDFSDLEQFAIKLLEKNSEEIKQKYDHILIDEYQDTNAAQAQIFEYLSRGGNTFVVGDVKQSIYRFRNAQPQLFLKKTQEYKDPKSSNGEVIYLANSFRSCKGIVDVVNYIFERIMSKNIGEVDYQSSEKLIYSGGGGGLDQPAVELHIVEKRLDDDADLTDEEWQLDALTREAILVARRIVKLVEEEKPLIFDKKLGKVREVTYRDITILMRKTKTNANILAGELALLGVPVYCEESDGYFASIEITTVLSLLRVIDNPMHDISLLSVLRSPLFQFTDDELVILRSKDKKKSLYTLLKESSMEKCKKALNKIKMYREKAKHMGLEELIRFILADTGYEAFVSAMPNSEMRMMNLRLICQRAGKFEQDGYKSVYDFIQYISEMMESSASYTMAKVFSENENAVRIMSIHKSKGLEFPVVFLVNCGNKFNLKDTQNSILFDLELGIGADLIDIDKSLRFNNISKQAIVAKKKYEMLSEEMRILYVALTRAINKVYIYGSVNDLQKADEKWDMADASAYHIAKQNTLLDWICIGVKGIPKEMGLKIEQHKAYDIILSSRNEAFAEEKEVVEDSGNKVNKEIYNLIDNRFNYQYPWKGINIPSKLSVSEIISSDIKNKKPSIPKFIKQKQDMTSEFRGIVIHFVMQNLNIQDTNTEEQINTQIMKMVNQGMISPPQADVVDVKRLFEFFKSDIGKRLKNSSNIQREVKFLVELKADEILDSKEDDYSEEVVLVQGVVDCYFEEEDGIVILDFKTGGRKIEYEKQVKMYEKCLGRFLNKRIKESHICYL